MGSNLITQMSSLRRTRGFVLSCLISCLVLVYYFDLLGGLSAREEGVVTAFKSAGQQNVVASSFSSSITPPTWYSNNPSSTSTYTSSWEQKSVTPHTRPTPSTTSTPSTPSSLSSLSQHDNDNTVTPSSILLIFKTGASTIWRRMPLHLLTTLTQNDLPNHVLYSDLSEALTSSITALDILFNVSTLLKSHDASAYDAYLSQQSSSSSGVYREHARLLGDEPPDSYAFNSPGWLLDKYKFLPMLAHAARGWSSLKWYIYVEDDTYIFVDNVLHYLSSRNASEVSYWGAYSGDGNATFAQGGSGIAFSGALMRGLFGGEEEEGPTLERYVNETKESCCGDIMLGKVLSDYGVKVNEGGWGSIGWRPEPPWKTGFEGGMWCERVFTFHHLHQRDLVVLGEVERRVKKEGRAVLFRDIYISLIAPHLTNSTRSNWDNFASKYILTNNTFSTYSDLSSISASILEAATSSPENCQKTCLELETCMSWRHDSAKQECNLDTAIKLGRKPDPQPAWEVKTNITSGWVLERIERVLLSEECHV